MKPNHINEQCAAMLGWKLIGLGEITPLATVSQEYAYWDGGSRKMTMAEWKAATNRDHLQLCVEFAAKDRSLWGKFSHSVIIKLMAVGYPPNEDSIVNCLLLPTLTLATLLAEAWEETR